MGDKIQYQRSFWMFKQEDTGFSNGQEPSGYVKIEVRDGKGKLSLLVQNLKEGKDKYNYKAYIIRCNDGNAVPVHLGTVPIEKNKGELLWNFDPANVGASGMKIEDFNMAAVILDDKNSSNIVCPLAAYKGTKTSWKEAVRKELSNKIIADVKKEDHVSIKDIVSKYNSSLESKYTPKENVTSANMPNADVKTINEAKEIIKNSEWQGNNSFANNTKEQLPDTVSESPVQGNQENKESNDFHVDDISIFNELINSVSNGNMDIKSNQNGNSINSSAGTETGSEDTVNNNESTAQTQINPNYPAGCPVEGCGLKQGNIGPVDANNGAYHPCAGCIGARQANATAQNTNSIDSLRENLDKYFETYNPFKSKRRDYKWWKINNPVYLNNFLYQNNIKTPLLFNPNVLMAHFKYRHLIFGIYTDVVRKKEYIVCGVPGIYSVDDRPLGEVGRWVQVEGNRQSYGAFGYWLAYIDPKTGKFLSFN